MTSFSPGMFVRVHKGNQAGRTGIVAHVINGMVWVCLTTTETEQAFYPDELRLDQRESERTGAVA